jgi:hypothetical protein
MATIDNIIATMPTPIAAVTSPDVAAKLETVPPRLFTLSCKDCREDSKDDIVFSRVEILAFNASTASIKSL